MKRTISLRILSLFCALALLISILPGLALNADAAGEAEYTNTGTRHVIAEELSAKAIAYYTGSNTMEVFETLQGVDTDNSVEAAGGELFLALQNLMYSTLTNTVSYSSLTKYWKYTDASSGSSDAILFYSDIYETGYNREHVWPKSQGNFYESGAGSDLQHLRPTNPTVNSTRSHYTMGYVRGVLTDYKTCTYGGQEVLWLDSSYTENQDNGIVEVMDSVKGDVARILLYVYVTYGKTGPNPQNLNLFTRTASSGSGNSANEGNKVIESLDTLLQWCEDDPVDTWEMSRNDCCQVVQGNRNVFIDYPELAWMLFDREIPDMDTPSGYAHDHQSSEFTVTCVSDDEEHGTVSGSGKSFTAVPAEGWYTSGWTLDPDDAAEVRQIGNSFRLSKITANCTLTVHFSQKTPAVLYFSVPEGVSCDPIEGYLSDTVELPTPVGNPTDDAHDWQFVGWVKAPLEETEDKPEDILPAGEEHVLTQEEDTLFALYRWTDGSGSAGDGNYYRVETTDEVVDGKYLIVYEEGRVALDGSLEVLDDNGNTVPVTISDHVIPASEDVDEAAFLYSSSDGSFLGSGGKYLGCVTDKNSIADSTEPIENTVSVTNGDAAVRSNNRSLRFNKQSGQERFRYYGSGQEPIALYLCQGTAAVWNYSTLTEPVVPEPEYYLVGTMNDWTPDAEYRLTASETEGKFVLEDIVLTAGTGLKVCDAANDVWYPDGFENEYVIAEDGTYDLEFWPAGEMGEDYHYGFFKLTKQQDFLFDDVQDPGKFYYEPVYWAYFHDPQITTGTSDTMFSPNNICTRGQVVTFLWRAMGEPEPTQTTHSFTDVKETAYYYKAMLWAVENEITTGTTATTFSPNKNATRGQVVTFLWRAMGEPEPTQTTHNFTDVKEGAYYYTAMLWAVENGVASGTSATAFSPNKDATRGHVVTFLYRALYGKEK